MKLFPFIDVFHRKMHERIHAFVGLMGIPIMRKDLRVTFEGQELVSNQKFKLQLLADFIPSESLFSLKKVYNVTMFEYSTEALEQVSTIGVAHIVLFCQMPSDAYLP